MSCHHIIAWRRWYGDAGQRSLHHIGLPMAIKRKDHSTRPLVRCADNLRHRILSTRNYANPQKSFLSRSKLTNAIPASATLSMKYQFITARSFSTNLNSGKVIDSVHNRTNLDDETAATGESEMEHNPMDNGNNEKNESLLKYYESLIQLGEITRDPHQIQSLKELDRLRDEYLSYFKELDEKKSNGESRDGKDESWSMTSLFSLASSWAKPSTYDVTIAHQRLPSPPKGVYLHGGVGCGKTYCMNLFFDALPSSVGKQKVHFHKFMLNIHNQMHEAKMIKNLQGAEVIDYVIQSTLSEGKILCFDEFQVTDVADALILKTLFTGLIENGMVIVATSNRPPADLYKGGLQRDLFLPFIDLLDERCAVVSMWESEVDYRLVQNDIKMGAQKVYFVEENDEPKGSVKDSFERLFETLTKDSPITSMVLDVRGRGVFVPKTSEEYDIARFSFDDLCGAAKGAADYLAIGERFHTIFIEDVPKLKSHEVNLVRRWITLIDALYECHVKLVIHAKANPENMFQVDLGNEHCDEAFAFDRTRSRMEEMRSEGYLRKKWIGARS